jgi:prepilin-type N-terminal cleavage/methylation domain-containing protein
VRTRTHQDGFTLIEAIAAVVILSVAVPPMLWAIQQAQAHRVNAILACRARWLAAEKLEDVMADRHSGTRGYSYLVPSNYPHEPSIAGFPGLTRSVGLVETGPDLISAGSGYMRATVTTTYTDVAGVPRSLTLTTILTDYTP